MTTAPKGRPDPRRREPLWTRVDRNRIRLAAYVALFVVSAVVSAEAMLLVFGSCAFLVAMSRFSTYALIAPAIAGSGSVVTWSSALVAGGALAWAVFAINRSEHWLVAKLGATFVPKGDLIPTKMALKDMALAGGLGVAPALYLLDASSVNAFVFSARHRRPIVGITRGMIDKVTIDEQRAVFANLVARIVSGDTIVDTGVSAIMMPLNTYRARRLDHENREMDRDFLSSGSKVSRHQLESDESSAYASSDGGFVMLFFLFGIAMAVLGSAFSVAQRRRQLRAAEKADAEGMLLLKDPEPMLSALEKCVELNNAVAASGPTFSDLFYCWPGMSTNDDDDPEWERVARLREVLGVEGVVDERDSVVPDGLLAPHAPRLD